MRPVLFTHVAGYFVIIASMHAFRQALWVYDNRFPPDKWDTKKQSLHASYHSSNYKKLPTPIYTTKLTDWTAFRQDRLSTGLTSTENVEGWLESTQATIDKHFKCIVLTTYNPSVDSHSLTKRLCRQKYNRHLKLCIAALTTGTEKYADHLAQQNWGQMRTTLQGTLGTAKTWHILRHLLNPTQNKWESQHTMKWILHTNPGTVHNYPGTNCLRTNI